MAAYTTRGVFFCLILVFLKDYSVTCDQIRLVGGPKPHEGRLQIKKPNDRWREMCNDRFLRKETNVACNKIRNDIDDMPLAHDFREVDRIVKYRIDHSCIGIEGGFGTGNSLCTISKVVCATDDICCRTRNVVYLECIRKAYDCGSNNPCYPSLATPGVRAYNHIDKNQIVHCQPDQKGTHACVTSKCPTSTEYDHIAKRCFSYEEFDCGSRDPCPVIAAQTSQTIYRRIEGYSKHYVECVYQKDWTTKCVHKTCSFGIVDVATQACV